MKINFNNTFKAALLIIITGIVISGCKKDDEHGCGTPLMTFLADGHKFRYAHSGYLGFVDTVDITIKKYGTDGVFQFLQVGMGGHYDTLYLKECDGWLYRSSDSSMFAAEKIRKSITAVGEVWTSSTKYRVTAKNVSITVPAGTFICDEIKYDETSAYPGVLYFNNTAGEIKDHGGKGASRTLISKNF
ncbi:MAG TPA: hypothetical protein VJY62_14675 [Bacteroidia bacterium]|nr:hypothetical protein [Bacteroidia bacterium]